MLTPKVRETYEAIRRYILTHGYAPTEAEIAQAIGITSTGVVHRYVMSLKEAGLLSIIPKRRRNIRLVDDVTPRGLPIVGSIAAGSPIEAIEDQRMLDVTATLLGAKRFILQVKGDSMVGDNICDGDYIVCESCETASKREIVVALVDHQEATLKRFCANPDGTVSLIPSNPALSPMVYASERVKIQGIYLGLLRWNGLI